MASVAPSASTISVKKIARHCRSVTAINKLIQIAEGVGSIQLNCIDGKSLQVSRRRQTSNKELFVRRYDPLVLLYNKKAYVSFWK